MLRGMAAIMSAHKARSHYHRVTFALAGLRHAWQAERGVRLHLLAVLVVAGVLAWLRPPAEWWALAALACALVIAAELLNTAVEALADHLHPERDPAIAIVKDCAAAGVLIASLGALAVAGAFVIWWWTNR